MGGSANGRDEDAPAIVCIGHRAIALAKAVAELGDPELDAMMRQVLIRLGRVIAADIVRSETEC